MRLNLSETLFCLFLKEEPYSLEKIKKLSSQIFQKGEKNFYFFLPYGNQDVRKALKDYKFNKKIFLSRFFAEILYENLPEILFDLKIKNSFSAPLLVTVPTFWTKRLSRSYDQNALLVKKFLKMGGKNFVQYKKNVLIKIKNNKSQSLTENKKERLENPKGSFFVLRKKAVKERNIILFDDILTTGSTAKEICKLLKKAGAKKIVIVTLAH